MDADEQRSGVAGTQRRVAMRGAPGYRAILYNVEKFEFFPRR